MVPGRLTGLKGCDLSLAIVRFGSVASTYRRESPAGELGNAGSAERLRER
jgi:hypothetical protein